MKKLLSIILLVALTSTLCANHRRTEVKYMGDPVLYAIIPGTVTFYGKDGFKREFKLTKKTLKYETNGCSSCKFANYIKSITFKSDNSSQGSVTISEASLKAAGYNDPGSGDHSWSLRLTDYDDPVCIDTDDSSKNNYGLRLWKNNTRAAISDC